MSEIHVTTDGLTDLARPLEVGDQITGRVHKIPGKDGCRCGCQFVEGSVGEVIASLTTGHGHLVIGQFTTGFGNEPADHPQIAFYQRLDETPEATAGTLLDKEQSR